MRYASLLLLLVVWACEDKPVTVDMGTDFFPLRTGREWTYSVNQTTYSYLNAPQEHEYELKITVTDSTITQGVVTYSLVLATRNSAEEDWEVNQSWSAQVRGHEAIQNESNVTRVKMVFPVGKTTVWNGNLYNDEPPFLEDYVTSADQQLCRIENFDESKELSSGLNFNSTLTVVISNLIDPIIGQDVQKEIYARHVGLIVKDVTQLVYCNQGSCSGLQQGIRYTQTLTSYVP